MNINYISGFFDADGSITLSRKTKTTKYKSTKIDFTNTEICILLSIQKYLFENYNLKGYISKKPARKENHSVSYALSYSFNNAYNLCKLLNSSHPKKLHRINCVLKYYKKITNRNGKYSEKEINTKIAFERLFFWTLFS